MTHHAEFEPQATLSGEDSALKRTKQARHLGRGGDATPLIHNMIGDYLDVEKAVKKSHDGPQEGESPEDYAAREESLNKYLNQRRGDIVNYVDLSIEGDALDTNDRMMRRAAEAGQRYAELYVNRELLRARVARIQTMAGAVIRQALTGKLLTEHPGHITIEHGAELESDGTIAFVDVVKGGLKMSARALRKIAEAPVIHSEEITLPKTQPIRDDRELLDDPKFREDITETINHIKPWQS